jgi:phosphoribosylformylglycinamidine synthase
MSFFRCLPGADALSVFRQQRLLSHLHQEGIELQSIHAQYLHFIWSVNELSSQELVTLYCNMVNHIKQSPHPIVPL